MAWCEPTDVQALLAGLSGNNFDASHYEPAITQARDTIITELAGKFDKATYDAWDADINAVPPTIKDVCAFFAAARILTIWVEGNSVGDTQSKAGGYYKYAMDRIKSIKADTSMVATGVDDNTPVTPASGVIATNKTSTDRVFTKTSMENL